MAEENHDGVAEILESLQDNENSATLLPAITSHTNDNSDKFSNPKPDVNLQLSLGGFYDKTPNSAPDLLTLFPNAGDSSVLKRSYFEQNKFMTNDVEEIKITREVQVIKRAKDITKNQEAGSAETSVNEKSKEAKISVSPLDIPVWAAQSASQNPAFQRALNFIKSEGSLHRTRRSTNSRGDTSKKPHAIEGFGSQQAILHQALKNGNSISMPPFNYGINQRLLASANFPSAVLHNSRANTNSNLVKLQKPSENLNFSGASGNGIFNHQLQNVKFVSPFNRSLATMERLPHWSTDGSLIMHPKAAAFAASTSGAKISFPFPVPAPFGTKANSIPNLPQNATGYEKSFTSSSFPLNSEAAAMATYPFSPFLATSGTNANGNPFVPREPKRPFAIYTNSFAGSGVTAIPLPEMINVNPPGNPCKRARDHNHQIGEAELELMKQMQTAVTTGGNPNGKKTEGFLYKHSRDQKVIIICVCHGCFFSPEEFVKHVGGSDLENQRQLISFLGYPDWLMKLDHTNM